MQGKMIRDQVCLLTLADNNEGMPYPVVVIV
jgi:hypothetical protein